MVGVSGTWTDSAGFTLSCTYDLHYSTLHIVISKLPSFLNEKIIFFLILTCCIPFTFLLPLFIERISIMWY